LPSSRPRYLTNRFVAAIAVALSISAVVLATPRLAAAQTAVQCEGISSVGADTQLKITQYKASVAIEMFRPNSANRKVEIEYGDEVFSRKFGTDGKIRISFGLTAAENSFVLSISETPPIECKANVPDFNRLYRAILRWHDPVQLDLNVLEPGGQMGSTGHISPTRPNTQLNQGLGQIDVLNNRPTDGTTGEISYVVSDLASLPQGGGMRFRLDYVTRGSQPELPYCDEGTLAAPQFELIIIDRGVVNTRKLGMNRVRCREAIPEASRLLPIRQ